MTPGEIKDATCAIDGREVSEIAGAALDDLGAPVPARWA